MRVFDYELGNALARLPAERLLSLQAFWEINVSTAIRGQVSRHAMHADDPVIAAMATPWAAMAAVQKLNDSQRKMLKAVQNSAINRLPLKSLLELVDDPSALQDLLAPLLENFVFLVNPGGYYSQAQAWPPHNPIPTTGVVAIPNAISLPLQLALQRWENQQSDPRQRPLDLLAAELGEEDAVTCLGMDVAAVRPFYGRLGKILAGNLCYPEHVQRALEKMPPRAKRFFEELVKSGEVVPLEELLSGPKTSPRDLFPILYELGRCGLIFPAFREGRRACFVHPAVAAASRGEEPPAPTAVGELIPVETPPLTADAGKSLWWNMMVLALWAEAGDARLTKSGTMHQRTLDRLLRITAPQNHPYRDEVQAVSDALTWLQNVGLVKVEGLSLAAAGSWDNWLKYGLIGEAGLVLAAWLSRSREEDIQPIPALGRMVLARQQVRTKLLEWLGKITPGQWYRSADFIQWVLATEPFFLRSRKQIIDVLGQAGIQDLYDSWPRQEGLAILVELFDLPLEAGIVEGGWDPGGGDRRIPAFFRLTSFGEQVVKGIGFVRNEGGGVRATLRQPVPNPGQPLIVQPNMEVLLLEFVPEAAYSVGRFAQPARFDKVGVFTITSESVKSAANRGMGYAQMMGPLQKYSAREIPQNVEYQLKEWASSIRTVRFERATVVEVDSPEDLEALLSSKPMRTRVLRRLSPTSALISVGADIESLGKALEPMGFNWTPPEDWDEREQTAYRTIHRTLKRFDRSKY